MCCWLSPDRYFSLVVRASGNNSNSPLCECRKNVKICITGALIACLCLKRCSAGTTSKRQGRRQATPASGSSGDKKAWIYLGDKSASKIWRVSVVTFSHRVCAVASYSTGACNCSPSSPSLHTHHVLCCGLPPPPSPLPCQNRRRHEASVAERVHFRGP